MIRFDLVVVWGLSSLKIGDTIDVKGPMGNLIYYGEGKFTFMGKPGRTAHWGMVAGGTGK